MHPKIPETELPVQGFFYAGGADQNWGILPDQDEARKEVIDGQRIQIREN